MCQIQLVHKFDNKKLTKEDIIQFKSLMLKGSESNDDAWGYYSVGDNRLSVHSGELQWEMMDEIDDVNTTTIFGHNRLATHGNAKELYNNHPFESENFVLVHNGVLSSHDDIKRLNDFNYNVETDSYIIVALLEKIYADTKNVEETIINVAKSINGSFSVLLLFKPTNRIFYFKENGTRFTFGLAKLKSGDTILASTNGTNLEELYSHNNRGDFFKTNAVKIIQQTAKPLTLMELTSEGLYDIGEIVEGTYYDVRSQKWDSVIKSFIKATLPVKSNNSKFDNKHTNLRTQSKLDERVYDCYGHEVKSTDINNTILKGLNEIREDLEQYLQKNHSVNVLHHKMNIFERKIRMVLSTTIGRNEKQEISSMYKDYGDVTFSDRVKSKLTELVLSVNDYMFDVKGNIAK